MTSLRKYWRRWFQKRGLEARALERPGGWLVFVSPAGTDHPLGHARALGLDDALRDAYRSYQEACADEVREKVLSALAALGGKPNGWR